MGKCLVTTLKDVADDNTLVKLGELRFEVITSQPTFKLRIATNAPVTITAEDGYITDSSGATNLGMSTTVNNIALTNVFFKGTTKISISNKYAIGAFGIKNSNDSGDYNNYLVKMKASDFIGMTNLYWIEVNPRLIEGDWDDIFKRNRAITWVALNSQDNPPRGGNLKGSTSSLIGLNITNFGTMGYKDFDGPLSNFSGMTTLAELHLNASSIKGDLSALTPLTNLRGLSLGTMDITGDISALPSSIERLSLVGDTKVTGNISSLPSGMVNIDLRSCANIVGALSAFANMPNLQKISIDGTSISGDTSVLRGNNLTVFTFTNCPNITGTWPLT